MGTKKQLGGNKGNKETKLHCQKTRMERWKQEEEWNMTTARRKKAKKKKGWEKQERKEEERHPKQINK